ncbi:MAG: DUF4127 family protein [Anaerolineae bacterium]
MKVALIPLDERPVNTRYPRMIAEIAGADVLLPPPELLPKLRQPGDPEGLFAWLSDASAHADRRIISAETLLYGGLIASRITDESPMDIIQRAAHLAALPPLPTTAFNLIMRIPDADDAIEEPAYWGQYGRRLHRLSQLLHRRDLGEDVHEALRALLAAIPQEVIGDFMRRRLRNHTVNLTLLHMAADGLFDLLVLSSDDTSEYGMGTQEKGWMGMWARRLNLSEDRVLMYPGADEVGCVLLMRALLAGRCRPTFYVHYAIAEDCERVAPYEDSPIRVTVERQIRALGGQLSDDREGADFVVAVNPPSRIGQEYDAALENFALEQARRAPFLELFVRRVRDWVETGRRVIVCDVAYPNGSDPDLIAGLLAEVDLTRLSAYGAWNTAGNTIGVALAQGVAASMAASAAQEAQQRFLLHRFIEDWGYQHVVRQQIRDALERETGRRDTTPDNEAATVERIHAALNALLPQLGALAAGWRIARVRLPWHRTFEVDFDLEKDGT